MSKFPPITPLLRLNNSTLDWCIKVRVVRRWNMNSSLNSQNITEIHMILLDQEGKKIQASIPAQCVDMFSHILYEDHVYMMAFFYVKDNLSPSMTTLNQFRLYLCSSTKIIPSQSLTIPHYSLMLFHSQRISNYRNGLSYLIDVIGVVTGVHEKPATDLSQHNEIAVKVTLSDKRGDFECLLLGEYADEFKIMMHECRFDLPILLLQYVKVKNKQGIAYIESVEDITKLLLNPPIIELERFKIDIGYVNGNLPLDKKEYYSSSRSCKVLEFNGLYPHKTIYEFIHMMEDGLFVLCGKVICIFKIDQWFYPVCHCGEFLDIVCGTYYCVKCSITVFSASSKCNLQVSLQDVTSAALLPMDDNLIEGIHCHNNNGTSFVLSANGENMLIDKQVLMIVKKIQKVDEFSDDIVEVIRITDDIELINQFHLNENNFTPAKSIFQTTSAVLPYDMSVIGKESFHSLAVDSGTNSFSEDSFNKLVDVSAAEYHQKYKEFKIRNDRVFGEGCSSNIL